MIKLILQLKKNLGRPVFVLVRGCFIGQPLEVVNITSSFPDLSTEKNAKADYILIGFRVKR